MTPTSQIPPPSTVSPPPADPSPPTTESILNATLEELSLCYESLNAFYKLGDTLLHYSNLSQFLQKSLSDLSTLVQTDLIYLSPSPSLHPSLLSELQSFLYFTPIPSDPALKRHLAFSSDSEFVWESLPEIAHDPLLSAYPSGICCPMRTQTQSLGTITLAKKTNTPYLNSAQLSTIRTFSDLFAIAIAQANNAIIRDQAQRLINEIEIASELQKQILPVPPFEDNSRWSLSAYRKSARYVAGDYIDFKKNKTGSLCLFILDVMGKGVPAAFVASMLRTAFHMAAYHRYTTLGLAQVINHLFCQLNSETTIFATCAIASISRDLSSIEIINAGHCQPLLLRPNQEPIQIQPSGPPLGIDPDADYQLTTLPLLKNDTFLMITDGLFEWPYKDLNWGWENFINFIKQNQNTPDSLWPKLQELIQFHNPSAEPSDDQTMLVWHLK